MAPWCVGERKEMVIARPSPFLLEGGGGEVERQADTATDRRKHWLTEVQEENDSVGETEAAAQRETSTQ